MTTTPKPSIFRTNSARLGMFFALAGSVMLAGCAQTPGPSVPSQPGKNLAAAKLALANCHGAAHKRGNGAVAGSYVAGVLLGGLVVGPIVVASNQERIRNNGEATGADLCLQQQGYTRRDLTPEELQALNRADASQRRVILDHLIGGGSMSELLG